MTLLGESAQARYREQLAALSSSDVLVRSIAEAGTRLGWGRRLRWARTYERFDPDEEPFATCVYEAAQPRQRIARVEAFSRRPEQPDADAAVVRAGGLGWVRVTRFPADPALPTLPAVLAGPGRRTVVRYRPYRRCTIRVDDGRRTRFAKLFADARAERAHVHGLVLWRAARRGELGFSVARPERFDPSTGAVWQETIEGAPVVPRIYGAQGVRLAERIGRAAASLTRSSIEPREVVDGELELACSERHCLELGRRVPRLAEPAAGVLEELRALQDAAGETEPRPIHGALHARQWLESASRLALLDYDALALGDPELDAATFLAGIDDQNRARVPVDRLNAAFLAGYEAVAGPLDPRLLAAYRAHKRLGKALKLARSFRPDGDRKAERRLIHASQCLEGVAA